MGYCDAAYAIILNEYQRPVVVNGRQYPGLTLEEALISLREWATGVTATSHEREEELIARRNADALATLGLPV